MDGKVYVFFSKINKTGQKSQKEKIDAPFGTKIGFYPSLSYDFQKKIVSMEGTCFFQLFYWRTICQGQQIRKESMQIRKTE